MALETVVFQPDPYSQDMNKNLLLKFGSCDNHGLGLQDHNGYIETKSDHGGHELVGFKSNRESSSSSASSPHGLHQQIQNNHCWPDARISSEDILAGEASPQRNLSGRPRKGRKTRSLKNREEVENQRITHIAVERNRRRQMNDYLSLIRSMMPPSYVQKGDQASIVGGAIVFLKQLEQHLQSLEAQKGGRSNSSSTLFSDFFAFPQYTTSSRIRRHDSAGRAESPLASDDSVKVADLEVTFVEGHATVKLLTRHTPKQLLKMVDGFYSLGLNVLHINLTRTRDMVFYTFSVKIEDEREMSSANEIATAVYQMVRRVSDDSDSIRSLRETG